MKGKKLDAGLLRTLLISALVLAVGLGAAFGLEFWFPTYDGGVASLSPELLEPVPGVGAAESDLDLYPWNYYESATAQPVPEEEKPLLQQYAVYILAAAYNNLSGDTLWPEEAEVWKEIAMWKEEQALDLANRFVRVVTAGDTYYFLKDAPVTLQKLEADCMVDCAISLLDGVVYFRVQLPGEKGEVTEAALSKAADAVRAIVSGSDRDEEGWDNFYRQLMGMMGLRYVFEEEMDIYLDLYDLDHADILTADDQILLVGQGKAQWVFLFEPLTLRLEGFSVQL
jgi:hypothetical protein